MSNTSKTCWIITEGLAGTENPCMGLAEALGIPYTLKRVKLRFPWKQLSPWLMLGHDKAPTADSDSIAGPYPDILITSGRKAIGIGLHIKKASKGKTFLIHIQDPKLSPKKFDAIIAAQHDPVRGKNVLVTKANLHRMTPEKLAEGRKRFEKELEHIPHPRLAVLIGGTSKAHTMTPENTRALAHQLAQLTFHGNAGLLVTASRRTGAENEKFLREQLNNPETYFWDGKGDNPYFGFLALADYIIVTEDSVSMTSEALATGKPVYIATLEGGAKRLNTFHKMLQEQGYTRPFTGLLEEWSYTPPDDTKVVAAQILKMIEDKKK